MFFLSGEDLVVVHQILTYDEEILKKLLSLRGEAKIHSKVTAFPLALRISKSIMINIYMQKEQLGAIIEINMIMFNQ